MFPHIVKKMKDAIFASRLPRVAAVARDVMLLVRALVTALVTAALTRTGTPRSPVVAA